MRIIAGQRRGHRIDGPRAAAGTKPTSDLVRESIFNILGELVEGRMVIDLFAGTGALGLEALSRGAERAVFVERDRENVGLIFRNIATLRYEDRTQVRHADAYRWAKTFRPVDDAPIVVLVDPPYREYEVRGKRVHEMLGQLVGVLAKESVLVIESGLTLDGTILPELGLWDVRRYGSTQLAVRVVGEASDGPVDRLADDGGGSADDKGLIGEDVDE